MIKLIAALLLLGCAGVNQKLDPDVFYQRDLDIECNGFKGTGTLVLPKNNLYHCNLTSPGRINLFEFTTCHRSITKEQSKIINGTKTSFDYVPVDPVETDGDCEAYLAAYSIGGKNAWGFVSFESPKYTLPALVQCNGQEYNSRGVEICQAKAGLIQQIIFSEPVKFVPQTFDVSQSSDGKTITFKMPDKEHVIIFKGAHGFNKLLVIGYQSVLVRGD